jgi:hypothetical protein
MAGGLATAVPTVTIAPSQLLCAGVGPFSARRPTAAASVWARYGMQDYVYKLQTERILIVFFGPT